MTQGSEETSDHNGTWKCVHFEPWIGRNYASSPLGLRLLVLGDSHYDAEGHNINQDHLLTRTLIDEQISGIGSKPFMTKLQTLISGRALTTWEEREEFWHGLAFSNYVQESVGNRSNSIPTTAMFDEAKPAFLEILDRIRPELVLVLGTSRLWPNLPGREDGFQWHRPPIKNPSSAGPTGECGWYCQSGFKSFSVAMYHPSSRYYSKFGAEHWRPILAQAMDLARSKKRL